MLYRCITNSKTTCSCGWLSCINTVDTYYNTIKDKSPKDKKTLKKYLIDTRY